MKHVLLVVLLAGAIPVIDSCGRKAQRQETTAGENVPATPAPVATNEASQPLEGPADPGMTEQLRIFVQEHGRLPTDFAEFIRARLDSVPRVPQGMKWAIDPATQEVKLVKR